MKNSDVEYENEQIKKRLTELEASEMQSKMELNEFHDLDRKSVV